MTDLPPPPDEPSVDDLDELVSAVLDGDATPEERARVDADPGLRARLAEMQGVRDLVAAPVVPLDELTLHRLRTAAVGAAHAPPVATAQPARGRKGSGGRAPWILASAAVVVLLALVGIPVLTSLSDQDSDSASDLASMVTMGDDEAEESEGDAGAPSESADDRAGTAESADDGEAATEMLGSPVDLGRFTDDDALAAAALISSNDARSSAAGDPTNQTDGAEALQDVPGADCPTDVVGELLRAFRGEVDGQVRVVRVVRDADNSIHAVVLDPASCEIIVVQPPR